jgi:hypothetical protein
VKFIVVESVVTFVELGAITHFTRRRKLISIRPAVFHISWSISV